MTNKIRQNSSRHCHAKLEIETSMNPEGLKFHIIVNNKVVETGNVDIHSDIPVECFKQHANSLVEELSIILKSQALDKGVTQYGY